MATGFLKRIFGAGGRFSPAAPDQPLFVIGDLHGRADLLDKLLDQARDGEQIICVGDYVDRGENSADVLARLHETPDILCLKGNHEDMLLAFFGRSRKCRATLAAVWRVADTGQLWGSRHQ